MRFVIQAICLLSLLCGWGASAFAQAPPPPLGVQTVPFHSALVGKDLPYDVILPVGYYAHPATRYPVLYLLHGLAGHYSDWATHTNVGDYAAPYPLILVMPEGNNNWYTDSATAPSDKYESYLLQELIPDVTAKFRVLDDRRGRAVAGLSMGGYGAFKLALKHPDMFAFAASMSGALDIETLGAPPKPGDWTLPHESITQVFGPEGSRTRKDNDVFALLRDLPDSRLSSLPYLYLDCGTEDGLLALNRRMDDLLLSRHVPHEYRERPGVHNWSEWDAQIPGVLKLAAEKMPLKSQ